jgi:hypothetical protein
MASDGDGRALDTGRHCLTVIVLTPPGVIRGSTRPTTTAYDPSRHVLPSASSLPRPEPQEPVMNFSSRGDRRLVTLPCSLALPSSTESSPAATWLSMDTTLTLPARKRRMHWTKERHARRDAHGVPTWSQI